MAASLTRFRVLDLHGTRSFDVALQDNKLILVGENGTGKSTIATLVFYFLTRQWKRLRTYRFRAIEVELNGQELRITPEMLEEYEQHAERAHFVNRRLPHHMGQLLFEFAREHPLTDLMEDPRLLARVSEELGVSRAMTREYVRRYLTEVRFEATELEKIGKSISAAVSEQILFLPTYRRIEQDLKAIFRGTEADIEKLRERLVAARTSPKYIELVEFGMADVERTINIRMDQVKESVRAGLNNLTGTYLRDVIKGDYADVNLAALRELDRATLHSIFARIDEETLPRQYKQRLVQTVEGIATKTTVGTEEAVIAHFLLKLFELYKVQQANEKDVRDFVRVCNRYLTGKELVYDHNNYQINIQQLDAATADDEERGLTLRALSSGEKQIVSLFSHIYLSGKKGFFVIIDEPELSLSVPWQRAFLPDILETGECHGLLAVTHSPFIWENELEPFVHSLKEFSCIGDVVRR